MADEVPVIKLSLMIDCSLELQAIAPNPQIFSLFWRFNSMKWLCFFCVLFFVRDMWNYLDVLIMLVYAFVITVRIATVIIGGDPYKNRLLELANYGYGFDGMLLILRFSSILELSSVIGPLQLALFRMCLDLLVILIQFGFVIVAFSLAITKCYTAETSFLTPLNSGSNNTE